MLSSVLLSVVALGCSPCAPAATCAGTEVVHARVVRTPVRNVVAARHEVRVERRGVRVERRETRRVHEVATCAPAACTPACAPVAVCAPVKVKVCTPAAKVKVCAPVCEKSVTKTRTVRVREVQVERRHRRHVEGGACAPAACAPAACGCAAPAATAAPVAPAPVPPCK